MSYVEAQDVIDRLKAKATAVDISESDGRQLRVYAPVDDLELAHLIVEEFGGMRGLARELKYNYDEAADSRLKVRILHKVMDFVATIASKAGPDPGASLAEMQKDMEARARAIMEETMQKAKAIGNDA